MEIGIFIIIRLIKLVVDTIIHGYALHSIYGWSLHLLEAVWTSVTNLLLHIGAPNQRTDSKNRRPTKTPPTTENLPPEICPVTEEQHPLTRKIHKSEVQRDCKELLPFRAFETRAKARHDTEPRLAAERGTALDLSTPSAQRWRSAKDPLSPSSPLSTAAAAESPKSRDLGAGPDSVSLTRDLQLASPKLDSSSKSKF
ncbi:hypothetical protein CAJAP_10329 [Camponotus japonicus]